jgi:hypothetical protein
MADERSIIDGLIARGMSPVQAAAVVGNMRQESGLNPHAVNAAEGANGLIQWRLDRWDGLRNFAASRGTSPNDQNTQLDFMMHELRGPEARAGSQFFAAQDLPSANRALKGYIRYGDDSEGTRLGYAERAMGGGGPFSGSPPAMSGSIQSQQTETDDLASTFLRLQPSSLPEVSVNKPASIYGASTGEDAVNSFVEQGKSDKLFSPRTFGRERQRYRKS